MYVVTITERTPTRPEDKDVNTYTLRKDTMLEALDYLEQHELNFACWVNVSITYVQEG